MTRAAFVQTRSGGLLLAGRDFLSQYGGILAPMFVLEVPKKWMYIAFGCLFLMWLLESQTKKVIIDEYPG
ncbi:hypothetical protein OROMI_027060 [Orobanche minor]